MVCCGLGPAGTDPCSMNRSTLHANTLGSGSTKPGSIGFNDGMVPSSEPGFLTLPCPWSPWHFWQLSTNILAPATGSPTSFSAAPGPPGLDGRGISTASCVPSGVAAAALAGTGVAVPATDAHGFSSAAAVPAAVAAVVLCKAGFASVGVDCVVMLAANSTSRIVPTPNKMVFRLIIWSSYNRKSQVASRHLFTL